MFCYRRLWVLLTPLHVRFPLQTGGGGGGGAAAAAPQVSISRTISSQKQQPQDDGGDGDGRLVGGRAPKGLADRLQLPPGAPNLYQPPGRRGRGGGGGGAGWSGKN